MKSGKSILVVLMLFILFSCDNTNETDEPTKESVTIDSTKTYGINAPIRVDEKIIKNINWIVSDTFKAESYIVRGIPNKVGFIDAPFIENSGQKYMWHFWGDIPNGKLTILAIKEGSNQIVPALIRDGEFVWKGNSPGGAINGADAHLPSNMKLSKTGKWALLIYIGEEYIDYIVVDVQ